MPGRTAVALILSLLFLIPQPVPAAEAPPPAAEALPDLGTLTRVPVERGVEGAGQDDGVAGLDEATWRKRFQNLRGRIEREERLLSLKRAELYDMIEQGKTEKKPRRFAIEGFVINTEKQGEEPRFIDPLEREVHEREKNLESLKQSLRELEFEASVAGVPKDWRY
ncbi:MAG: hypothetical protein Q8R92_04095 [Deltaproteobacteria bacterium]|nr:hypothetical protein [Deltaproteobacteria bacterium]